MKKVKWMQTMAIIVMAGYSSVAAAQAANPTYTTSTGSVFTQVQGPQGPGGSFGLAWKDAWGQIWSSYRGDYANIQVVDQTGTAIDNPAVGTCASIGGQLPTVQEYRILMWNFETDSNEVLTNRGQKDLDALFPDMQGRWFWTSDLDTSNCTISACNYAWAFGGSNARVRNAFPFYSENSNGGVANILSVRCVANGRSSTQ